ncbi:MAG: phosphomethylpyrimidine synthase ThiC [Desulfarculales bacterium]|nr:phosphomethylpyrimidine synthase ThiC [Desulfarculales bacterium]
MSLFCRNQALKNLWELHQSGLAVKEGLERQYIMDAIDAGRMVLLGNPKHPGLIPALIGQPARVKINANIGTSPWLCSLPGELAKLEAALQAGADTVMDLSIAGDLDAIRQAMLKRCSLPLGTVPLYAVAQRYISAGKDPAAFSAEELWEEIHKQAEQGVDFMTVHCGLTRKAAGWAQDEDLRVMGIVSRGGSILARWMRRHNLENPFLTGYERIIGIAREYNVTLSLGDGLRPGAGLDAGDAAQWEEVIMLGHLARKGLAAGVQCMVEGPGHVPLAEVAGQISGIKKLTSQAPLYVLGPLVTDISPGYDHIAGAIGAANAVMAGADFLCYLTPAEHLTLPCLEDVKAGIMASRIAAQAGETALKRPQALAREAAMAEARKRLDWPGMSVAALDSAMVDERRKDFSQKEACAMCGEFCAVKMALN